MDLDQLAATGDARLIDVPASVDGEDLTVEDRDDFVDAVENGETPSGAEDFVRLMRRSRAQRPADFVDELEPSPDFRYAVLWLDRHGNGVGGERNAKASAYRRPLTRGRSRQRRGTSSPRRGSKRTSSRSPGGGSDDPGGDPEPPPRGHHPGDLTPRWEVAR